MIKLKRDRVSYDVARGERERRGERIILCIFVLTTGERRWLLSRGGVLKSAVRYNNRILYRYVQYIYIYIYTHLSCRHLSSYLQRLLPPLFFFLY